MATVARGQLFNPEYKLRPEYLQVEVWYSPYQMHGSIPTFSKIIDASFTIQFPSYDEYKNFVDLVSQDGASPTLYLEIA